MTHPIEKIWREVGLPEYFLGNGDTNKKLIGDERYSPAQLQQLYFLRRHMQENRRTDP